VRRLVSSAPDAHADFHAMLWWGRALMDWIEGRWGERVNGEIVDHPQLLQQSLFAHQRKAPKLLSACRALLIVEQGPGRRFRAGCRYPPIARPRCSLDGAGSPVAQSRPNESLARLIGDG
jgi:hypothetical protein